MQRKQFLNNLYYIPKKGRTVVFSDLFFKRPFGWMQPACDFLGK